MPEMGKNFCLPKATDQNQLRAASSPPIHGKASRGITARAVISSILKLFGWTRSSSVLLGGFFLVCGLIVYLWWPLAQEALAYFDWSGPWWLYMDWLLVGIFTFMSLTIISHADLRRDALIVFVGMLGGLVIES